jgi:hypothetical protein
MAKERRSLAEKVRVVVCRSLARYSLGDVVVHIAVVVEVPWIDERCKMSRGVRPPGEYTGPERHSQSAALV